MTASPLLLEETVSDVIRHLRETVDLVKALNDLARTKTVWATVKDLGDEGYNRVGRVRTFIFDSEQGLLADILFISMSDLSTYLRGTVWANRFRAVTTLELQTAVEVEPGVVRVMFPNATYLDINTSGF